MEGRELPARRDDFRLNLSCRGGFGQVVIYPDEEWREIFWRVGTCFATGEMHFFDDRESAIEGLKNGQVS